MKLGSLFLRRQSTDKETVSDKSDLPYSYDRIINTVKLMILGQDIEQKLTIYDFAIMALGQELAGESGTAIFRKHSPYSEDCKIPFAKVSETKEIKFDHLNVVAYAWNIDRWGPAASSTIKYGFRREMNYYSGTYYPELRLLVIGEGLHHSTKANLLDCGSTKAYVARLEDIFETVYTDGRQWYTEGKAPVPAKDFRVAAMYTLAQERAKLIDSPGYVPATDFAVPFNLDSDREYIEQVHNERDFWKRKCSLLEKELEKLAPPEN